MQKYYKLIVGLLACGFGANFDATSTTDAATQLRNAVRDCSVNPQDLDKLLTGEAFAANPSRLDQAKIRAGQLAVRNMERAISIVPGLQPLAELPDSAAVAREGAERMGMLPFDGPVELESVQYRTGYKGIDKMLEAGEKIRVVIIPPAIVKAEWDTNPEKFVDCKIPDKLRAHQWQIGQYACRACLPETTLFRCIETNPLRFEMVWGTVAEFSRIRFDLRGEGFYPFEIDPVKHYSGLLRLNWYVFQVEEYNQFDENELPCDDPRMVFGKGCYLLENKNNIINTTCFYQFFQIPGDKTVLLKIPGVEVVDTMHEKPIQKFKPSGKGVYVRVSAGVGSENYYDTLTQSYCEQEGTPDGGVVIFPE